MLLKQSTARNRHVFITSSSDHIGGKTGLAAGLTIYASKNGGAAAAITPTVTEIDATHMPGWYNLALTTSHTDTLGDLSLTITGSGADSTDLVDQVVTLLPGDAVSLQADQAVNVTKVNGTGQTAADLGANSAAIKAKTDSLTFTVAGVVDSNVVDWKGATAPAMTGDAYARLGAPAGASVSADVAAVKTDTAAVKAKTDNLPSDPADESLVIAATNAIVALLGTPAGASVSADIAAVQSDTNDLQTQVGTAGAGLTALGDTRIAHLDADVSSVGGGSLTVQDIVDGVLDEATSGHQTAGSVGKAITDAQSAGDPMQGTAESGFTYGDVLRLLAAKNLGKTGIVKTGNGAATVTFRAIDDSADRVVGNVNGSERTSVTLTP